MTIHSEHPFATPEPDRDPVRRFRGRMPAPVTVWTTGAGRERQGWTIASMLLAEGPVAEVLGLLDADSDLADDLTAGADRLVVNLLGPDQAPVADAFARVAPAPGGPFTLGQWQDSEWGPVLADTAGWLGVRVTAHEDRLGWTTMVRGEVEHVELSDHAALGYLRGRYLVP
ncbi:flavin reductase family protein [Enemella sp. A6]|uniref:flavin reductase family protein n=1 Tax=Enemella sp. A6 TaxID=3440152 RepID=UPI003EB83865